MSIDVWSGWPSADCRHNQPFPSVDQCATGLGLRGDADVAHPKSSSDRYPIMRPQRFAKRLSHIGAELNLHRAVGA